MWNMAHLHKAGRASVCRNCFSQQVLTWIARRDNVRVEVKSEFHSLVNRWVIVTRQAFARIAWYYVVFLFRKRTSVTASHLQLYS